MQIDRTNFKGEEKKLKRYPREQQTLEKVLTHIKQCQSYQELCQNPISWMYGFEYLKHRMNGYCSFHLSKNGGVIRLICSIDEVNNRVTLEFISMDHYQDFNRTKRKEKVGK